MDYYFDDFNDCEEMTPYNSPMSGEVIDNYSDEVNSDWNFRNGICGAIALGAIGFIAFGNPDLLFGVLSKAKALF